MSSMSSRSVSRLASLASKKSSSTYIWKMTQHSLHFSTNKSSTGFKSTFSPMCSPLINDLLYLDLCWLESLMILAAVPVDPLDLSHSMWAAAPFSVSYLLATPESYCVKLSKLAKSTCSVLFSVASIEAIWLFSLASPYTLVILALWVFWWCGALLGKWLAN